MKCRKAREEYTIRRGDSIGFIANIALVSASSPRRIGPGRGEGGWEAEEDDDAMLEKARAARKKNPNLALDRRRSLSVGGLGAHPDTLRDGHGKGCGCTIA